MNYYVLTVNQAPEGIIEAETNDAAALIALQRGGTIRQLNDEEMAVYKPLRRTLISQVDFLRRFTQAERIAIRSAAKVNAQIEDYQYLLDRSINGVDLADPDVISGVQGLETAGILSPARVATILSV